MNETAVSRPGEVSPAGNDVAVRGTEACVLKALNYEGPRRRVRMSVVLNLKKEHESESVSVRRPRLHVLDKHNHSTHVADDCRTRIKKAKQTFTRSHGREYTESQPAIARLNSVNLDASASLGSRGHGSPVGGAIGAQFKSSLEHHPKPPSNSRSDTSHGSRFEVLKQPEPRRPPVQKYTEKLEEPLPSGRQSIYNYVEGIVARSTKTPHSGHRSATSRAAIWISLVHSIATG